MVENFFNNDTLRAQMGVDPEAGEYKAISWKVNSAFRTEIDMLQPTQHYVTQLLERGIKFLIFAGSHDMICNWVSPQVCPEKMVSNFLFYHLRLEMTGLPVD